MSVKLLAAGAAVAILLAVLAPSTGVANSQQLPNRVLAVIPVGSGPADVAFDQRNGYLYVPNTDSNNVSVINGSSNRVVGSVSVGAFPQHIAFDSRTGNLYISNTGSGTISVIDGANNSLLATIAPQSMEGPAGIAVDSADHDIYVAALMSVPPYFPELEVINDTSNSVTGMIELPALAHGVAYSSRNGLIYAALSGSAAVAVIDPITRAILTTIGVGPSPESITVDDLNGRVFVTSLNSQNVSVIDGASNTLVGSIPCGFASFGSALDTLTGDVYVTTDVFAKPYLSGLSVIDAANDTVLESLALGVNALTAGLAFDSANGNLYLAGGAGPQVVTVVGAGPLGSTSGLASITEYLLIGLSLAFVALGATVLLRRRRRRDRVDLPPTP